MQSYKSILCVDDDEDDVAFLSEALRLRAPHIKIAVAENGLKALNYLNAIKETDKNFPCLIVLDINMPYMDGKEMYLNLLSDPDLKKLPVVVFTSSAHPADKDLFNKLGIAFITKPHTLSGIDEVAVQMLSNC